MFLHCFRYELITTLRNRSFFFWLVLFPIVLGLCFKIAFADLYDKTNAFHTIPIAVVQQEGENTTLETVLGEVTSGSDALFSVKTCTREEAMTALQEGEVKGILDADTLELTVAESGMEQMILQSFLTQYQVYNQILSDTASTHPEKLEAVAAQLSAEIQSNESIPLPADNMDETVQYFYNLIAMVALFGSMTGLHISMCNQANLSQIGIRNNCSPVPKLKSAVAALCGSFVAQMIVVAICISYVVFVLQINVGNQLLFVYLSGLLGGCTGVSMGFFVGAFGRLGENAKVGLLMSVTMLCCAMSGLMSDALKVQIVAHLPWLNQINPAAVIADALYCLNVYSDYTVYTEKILTMLLLIVVFVIGGCLLTRRRKYASL